MYESINQLVGEITSLAVVISSNAKIDIFMEYMPHCNTLYIRVYKDGWSKSNDADIEESLCTKPRKYRTEKEILNKLHQIKQQFIRIARKGKINFSKLPYEIVQVKNYHLVRSEEDE
nr:MAG TPA: hypothetical protein [Caudoviricetes sp.]